MRNSLTVLTTVIFLITSCTEKQETPLTVLMKVKDNYDKRSSVTYKINYRHKFFDEDDTLQWDELAS